MEEQEEDSLNPREVSCQLVSSDASPLLSQLPKADSSCSSFLEQTGLNPNFIQGQVNANANALSSADQFNSLASARVQPTPRIEQQNFNPSNVFASMKGNKGMLDPSAAPQSESEFEVVRISTLV